ncbi:MAG: aminomethyl-transferring glycine dehydrogenase subunit GcvPA [Chloroflexi bacterium]|nr:aminomethyl-transferring glycine dehydrogenase subunit GcvPA [Chloroflexota bacterium]
MTHRFIPNTDADRAAMLKTIGVASVQDLFRDVPASAQLTKINLPRALSEMELLNELNAMATRNANLNEHACFLGAGAYNHFVPATVPHLIFRSEFYTAYTPYQAEISQGTLQTIFEYQSLICNLTGMDAANASHYDGATATAEAAILAVNAVPGRDKIIVAPTLHPEYRATLRTYLEGQDVKIVGDEDLKLPLDAILKKHLDDKTAGVIVQNPDFLGAYHDLKSTADRVHAAGALFIVNAYPISLGLFRAPGEYGADVVVGEGQSLGNAIAFGGPYLGIFATKEKYIRRMAGRLVGQTVDTTGRRGFTLTLQAREQHIRREKATSNICTNQALNALAACVYLSTLGKSGFKQVAELCYHKAHYAAKKINALPGYRVDLKKEFFNEFVVECPAPVSKINAALESRKIIGGYDLSRDYPHMKNAMLVAVTEMNAKEQIDQLVKTLAEATSSKRKAKSRK